MLRAWQSNGHINERKTELGGKEAIDFKLALQIKRKMDCK